MVEILFHYRELTDWSAQVGDLSSPEFHIHCVSENVDLLSLTDLWPRIDILWHVLTPVTQREIEAAHSLKLIQKLGVGVNTIDLEAAKKRGIAVCNMPGVNSNAVAEFTIGLMLSALRRIAYLNAQTRQGSWVVQPEVADSLKELRGKTVGVVGFGAIGQRVARFLAAFDANVIYWSRRDRRSAIGKQVGLEELFEKADVISLHLPAVPDTRMLVDKSLLERSKPGVILVNTARGVLVDEKALLEFLNVGRVALAVMDVFAQEPVMITSPLLMHPRVLATPHVAWLTVECLAVCRTLALENVCRLAAGLPLNNRVV
ncbi:MAG: NAD(P)-dependent oxidoreductase [Candidatus Sulfotelmatobacter sp.]|jgi:phosphoglycerate dehydrogenase-like enzyme